MRLPFIIAVAILILLTLAFLIPFTGKNGTLSVPGKVAPTSKSEPPPSIEKKTTNDAVLNVPEGFNIEIFARNLSGPRVMAFDSENNLLVTEMGAGRVIAFEKITGGQLTGTPKTVISGLNTPHGLAFNNGQLYVAEPGSVRRYFWNPTSLNAQFHRKVLTLPEGGQHSTRSILFDDSGNLFVSIGSTCNVCVEVSPFRAAIIKTNSDGERPEVYAKGLRNSVFMTLNPSDNNIWATDMGRDYLGDNLPPDEINIIEEGNDYGWPYCYGNKLPDAEFSKNNSQNICRNTIAPVFQVCAHCAPLGILFIQSVQFPKDWQGDLFVAYHGSWNRSTPSGYKIAHLKVSGHTVVSEEDFITGFLQGDEVAGRPVGMAFDRDGILYISDDKAGVIYRVNHL